MNARSKYLPRNPELPVKSKDILFPVSE